jgi:hypothetical protein
MIIVGTDTAKMTSAEPAMSAQPGDPMARM